MKPGVNQWCFPPDYDLEQCLELAAESGFAGFEVNLGEPGLSEAGVQKAVRKAEELGIRLHSVATARHWTYPFTAAEERVRETAVDIAERMLAVAQAMGAGTVLIVPGVVTGEVSYRTAYGRALEAMRRLAPVAEVAGVTIGVENVWNRFLLSPLEMRRFVEEVGSERVRSYLDVGNVLACGYPEQWVEVLGELICAVHVKDFRLEVGNQDGFVPLGHGDVAWSRVIEALRKVGYDGYLTVELPPRRFRPEDGVREAAVSLSAMIEEQSR